MSEGHLLAIAPVSVAAVHTISFKSLLIVYLMKTKNLTWFRANKKTLHPSIIIFRRLTAPWQQVSLLL